MLPDIDDLTGSQAAGSDTTEEIGSGTKWEGHDFGSEPAPNERSAPKGAVNSVPLNRGFPR